MFLCIQGQTLKYWNPIDTIHQKIFEIFDLSRTDLEQYFSKGHCSLCLNPWMTRQLCLRSLKVSLIVRRVHFAKIFTDNLLSSMTLVISFSLMMPEISSGLWWLQSWHIFLVRERYSGKACYPIRGPISSWYSFRSNECGLEILSALAIPVKLHIHLTKLGLSLDIWWTYLLWLPTVVV